MTQAERETLDSPERETLDNIETALRELHVSGDALDPTVRESLDRDGFFVFPELLDGSTVDAILSRVEELEQDEDAWTTGTNPEDPGAVRVDNLNHKGAVFDQLWVHPTLLAVMHHYLGEFRLGSMTARAPRPRTGHQRLHCDWQGAFEERYTACQSVWMLDDFNRATGTTRLIPGSHRLHRRPEDDLDDPRASHPDQLLVEAPRGSLAVFNGYIWHGGTRNTTDRLRRGIFTFFVRRDLPRSRDQLALLERSTRSRLGPAACYVLDV